MPLDTSYRTWPRADLMALRLSTLTQLKAIEGVGQSHQVSGRNTAMADFTALTTVLGNVNAALAYLDSGGGANAGNAGYASRYASYGY